MRRSLFLIITALVVTMPAHADSNKPQKHSTVARERFDMEQRGAFSPAERNLIRAQLVGQKRTASQQGDTNLRPGLQKKVARGKALPADWQKRVAPGQSLDYHVYRQGESLPDVLLHRLPPPPVGSEILRIEDKIVRLNSATRTILDVFDLIPAR